MGVSTSKNPELIAKAMEKAKSIVSSKPVVIFSKTYCPYCTQVKQLLTRLGTKPEVVELDTESDGPDIQAALKEWTGQRTVPNVFIGGTHIGGCDVHLICGKERDIFFLRSGHLQERMLAGHY